MRGRFNQKVWYKKECKLNDGSTTSNCCRKIQISKPHSSMLIMRVYKPQCFDSLHHSKLKMESPNNRNAQKCLKSRSQSPVSPAAKGLVRPISPLKALRNNPGPRDDSQKERQLVDKNKVINQKYVTKENTKPMDFKLHTQERAARRALFNYTVATKIYIMERQKRQVEKLLKTIEQEEVKLMRKEMIPRAQLMPYFDKPFFPQRSTRPLTIPREPSFKLVNGKC